MEIEDLGQALIDKGITVIVTQNPIWARTQIDIDTSEHDKQIRADARAEAIDDVINAMCKDCRKEPCWGDECVTKNTLKGMRSKG